jgi:carbon-monoxide dehydrogenase medium subunit
MIPVQFDYATATSVTEAVTYLEAHPDARVLAGGTGLIPALSRGRLAATALIDLQHIPGLAAVTPLDAGGVRIGALATLAEIAGNPDICASYPVLAEAIASAADPQIRNRATIGGSLVLDRRGGDVAAALLALAAVINVTGPTGDRTVAIDTLLGGQEAVRLGQADIVTSIDLPSDAAGSAYEKFRNPAGGFAICGIAALLRLDRQRVVGQCRLAVTGATSAVTGATSAVIRLPLLEANLIGQAASIATVSGDAFEAQWAALTFSDDWPASADYRAHLVRVLTPWALRRAAERAGLNK